MVKYSDDTLSYNKYRAGLSLPLHPEVLVLQDGQDPRQHLYLRKCLKDHAHLEHPDDVVGKSIKYQSNNRNSSKMMKKEMGVLPAFCPGNPSAPGKPRRPGAP